MNTKHTPGPWVIRLEGPARRFRIATEQPDCDIAALYPQANDEANARLIAAAPELLDELAAIVRRLAHHYPGFETTSARAAITKATGG